MRDEFGNSQNWHDRGYIPHYEADNKYQFITYRLADSLPQQIMARAPASEALAPLSGAPLSDAAKNIDRQRRIYIEKTLDKGYGSCILAIPELAKQIVSSWQFFNKQKYDLIAYVVMPNHVHLLIKVYPNEKIGNLVRSWKLYTTNFVLNNTHLLNIYLKAASESGAPSSGNIQSSSQNAASESGAPDKNSGKFTIWQREYWDRFIRDQNHYDQTITYIHNNPVKARLVKSANDWKWSSLS